MFPLALLIVALARQGLDLWLGPEFAEHGTRVLQLLTVGVLVNSLAQFPSSLVQGAGRPDLTAKLHLVELPLYLGAVWWVTRNFGIEGTAAVWSARVMVDAAVLFRMARGVLPQGSFGFKHAELPAGLALLVLALGMVPNRLSTSAAFLAVTMLLFLYVAWYLILDDAERATVQTFLKTALSSVQRTFSA
jgi:O-antigen/teichoic acid export membrane protein